MKEKIEKNNPLLSDYIYGKEKVVKKRFNYIPDDLFLIIAYFIIILIALIAPSLVIWKKWEFKCNYITILFIATLVNSLFLIVFVTKPNEIANFKEEVYINKVLGRENYHYSNIKIGYKQINKPLTKLISLIIIALILMTSAIINLISIIYVISLINTNFYYKFIFGFFSYHSTIIFFFFIIKNFFKILIKNFKIINKDISEFEYEILEYPDLFKDFEISKNKKYWINPKLEIETKRNFFKAQDYLSYPNLGNDILNFYNNLWYEYLNFKGKKLDYKKKQYVIVEKTYKFIFRNFLKLEIRK
ncbi:hypothetical protein [Spiroplasma alleghenense]|uniref:Uncharacterized protein n=1 Tax=Spiroplasma alleghenense TaxID=216931 RepID=A0A345Z4V1_9MOLU|nr:hypothetical protein [Spiroplasma alleghenense]AXK51630.1 hypothetical protein SALLE_v1c09600 [Spiroplasma alleghenense]